MSAIKDELIRLLGELDLPDEDLAELVDEVRGRASLHARASMTAKGRETPAMNQPGVDLRAVLELVSNLRRVPGVHDVRYSFGNGVPDLWLLVQEADIDEATDRIADLDYEFRRAAGSATYGLHVVPFDSLTEQDLALAQSV